MTTLFRRRRTVNFGVELTLLELTDITLRKAIIFAKVQSAGFNGETQHTEIQKHATSVVFNSKFAFQIRVPIVETNGELEKSECTITVRRADRPEKIGSVRLNLSEYFREAAVPDGCTLTGPNALLLDDCQDNSRLHINIKMQQQDVTDPFFRVPSSSSVPPLTPSAVVPLGGGVGGEHASVLMVPNAPDQSVSSSVSGLQGNTNANNQPLPQQPANLLLIPAATLATAPLGGTVSGTGTDSGGGTGTISVVPLRGHSPGSALAALDRRHSLGFPIGGLSAAVPATSEVQDFVPRDPGPFGHQDSPPTVTAVATQQLHHHLSPPPPPVPTTTTTIVSAAPNEGAPPPLDSVDTATSGAAATLLLPCATTTIPTAQSPAAAALLSASGALSASSSVSPSPNPPNNTNFLLLNAGTGGPLQSSASATSVIFPMPSSEASVFAVPQIPLRFAGIGRAGTGTTGGGASGGGGLRLLPRLRNREAPPDIQRTRRDPGQVIDELLAESSILASLRAPTTTDESDVVEAKENEEPPPPPRSDLSAASGDDSLLERFERSVCECEDGEGKIGEEEDVSKLNLLGPLSPPPQGALSGGDDDEKEQTQPGKEEDSEEDGENDDEEEEGEERSSSNSMASAAREMGRKISSLEREGTASTDEVAAGEEQSPLIPHSSEANAEEEEDVFEDVLLLTPTQPPKTTTKTVKNVCGNGDGQQRFGGGVSQQPHEKLDFGSLCKHADEWASKTTTTATTTPLSSGRRCNHYESTASETSDAFLSFGTPRSSFTVDEEEEEDDRDDTGKRDETLDQPLLPHPLLKRVEGEREEAEKIPLLHEGGAPRVAPDPVHKHLHHGEGEEDVDGDDEEEGEEAVDDSDDRDRILKTKKQRRSRELQEPPNTPSQSQNQKQGNAPRSASTGGVSGGGRIGAFLLRSRPFRKGSTTAPTTASEDQHSSSSTSSKRLGGTVVLSASSGTAARKSSAEKSAEGKERGEEKRLQRAPEGGVLMGSGSGPGMTTALTGRPMSPSPSERWEENLAFAPDDDDD